MARKQFAWASLPDEQLLQLRLRDLKVKVEGTWLEECLDTLHEELKQRELRVRPHAWISSEWFSPGTTPGIAIPFYLAHPRLMRLERKMILEVEGGTVPTACASFVTRPAMSCSMPTSSSAAADGRSFSAARRSAIRDITGRIRPAEHFVQHLRLWYAQSHPDEDFAETFAVWLQPRSDWRERYAGWPALEEARICRRTDGRNRQARGRCSRAAQRSIRSAS